MVKVKSVKLQLTNLNDIYASYISLILEVKSDMTEPLNAEKSRLVSIKMEDFKSKSFHLNLDRKLN